MLSKALATAREGVWFSKRGSLVWSGRVMLASRSSYRVAVADVQGSKQTDKVSPSTLLQEKVKKRQKRSADIIRSRCQNGFVLQTIYVQHSLDNPVFNNTYGPLYGGYSI